MEQGLAIKNQDVPVLSPELLVQPSPTQLWTSDVCAYLLSSLEHRAAFLSLPSPVRALFKEPVQCSEH